MRVKGRQYLLFKLLGRMKKKLRWLKETLFLGLDEVV